MKNLTDNILILYFDRDNESKWAYQIIVVNSDCDVYIYKGQGRKEYEAIIENIDMDSMEFKKVGKMEGLSDLKVKIGNIHSDMLCRLIKCEVGKGISELYGFNDDNYMMLASYGAVRNIPVNEADRDLVQKIKAEIARFVELIN